MYNDHGHIESALQQHFIQLEQTLGQIRHCDVTDDPVDGSREDDQHVTVVCRVTLPVVFMTTEVTSVR